MSKLFVVRHGMRLDHEDKSWRKTAERTFDPPLSERGHEQARKTGVYLKQFNIATVYASPLLRTIQTATGIVESLNLPIYIEDGLVEWLNPKWHDFSEGMLPLESLLSDYPKLNLDYRPLVRPRYPEQDEALCRARVEYVARQLTRENEGNVLLITHGACVMNVIEALTGSRDGATDQTCGVNILRKKVIGGDWVLESATVKHLSQSNEKVEYI